RHRVIRQTAVAEIPGREDAPIIVLHENNAEAEAAGSAVACRLHGDARVLGCDVPRFSGVNIAEQPRVVYRPPREIVEHAVNLVRTEPVRMSFVERLEADRGRLELRRPEGAWLSEG